MTAPYAWMGCGSCPPAASQTACGAAYERVNNMPLQLARRMLEQRLASVGIAQHLHSKTRCTGHLAAQARCTRPSKREKREVV